MCLTAWISVVALLLLMDHVWVLLYLYTEYLTFIHYTSTTTTTEREKKTKPTKTWIDCLFITFAESGALASIDFTMQCLSVRQLTRYVKQVNLTPLKFDTTVSWVSYQIWSHKYVDFQLYWSTLKTRKGRPFAIIQHMTAVCNMRNDRYHYYHYLS